MFTKSRIILGIFAMLFIIANSLTLINAAENMQEVTEIGTAELGNDPDRMYEQALEAAFYKAYIKVKNDQGASSSGQESKDLILIQKEFGISDYKILSFWKTDSVFNLEVKIIFGDTKNNGSEVKNLSNLPNENWMYQAVYPVNSIVKNNLAVAVNTAETMDFLDIYGKLLKKIKTGPGIHDVFNDMYIIKEKDYLKVSSFTKINILNLAYIWRKKYPVLDGIYPTETGLFLKEKTGFVKLLNWKDGSQNWQIAAPGLVNIKSAPVDRFLFTFTTPELWMVNSNGQKIWSQKVDKSLIAALAVRGNEIYCLLQDAAMEVLDLASGNVLGAWNPVTGGVINNVVLEIGENDVYMLYNDKNLQGHLQAYQRYTGTLRWEVTWTKEATDMLAVGPNLLIIGIENVLEARETLFGLKAWSMPLNRKVTKLYTSGEDLTVAAGNRVYNYDIR